MSEDPEKGRSPVPWLRLIYLVVGLALLAGVLHGTDLTQVGANLVDLGLAGALIVFGLYLAAFVVDTASWQLAVPGCAPTVAWLYRLWKVRMVGEAFNVVLPAASLGGEPVKAILLKRHHGVGYREGGASLVIARTVNLLSLIAFSAAGFVAMMASDALSPTYDLVAGVGLAALAAGVLGFFAVQRWQVSSRLLRVLVRLPAGRRLEALLTQIRAIEDHFHHFYARRRGRFAAALALAFLNWILGMVEVYVIMDILGEPVAWQEAWMMETVMQLVRTGTFFIPASIGASEAGSVIIVEALTGRPALGLALALIRRGREILWIAWGLWLGWRYSLSTATGGAE